MTRAALFTVWLGLGACASPPARPSSFGCVEDADCPDPRFYWCNPVTAECVNACQTTRDCFTRPAEFAVEACAGPLGCQCDRGTCVTALCSVDADCGARACRNGACVSPPTAELVARCAISPDVAVVKPGARVRFFVLAWDEAGEPVVVPGGAIWNALGLTLSGSGTGNTLEFRAGSSMRLELLPAVEARFGRVRCQARALVVPPPAPGSLAVSVVDARTGRPIGGAQVVLSRPDGVVLPQPSGEVVETDLAGFAKPTLPSRLEPYSLSVFHPDFSYATLANVAGSVRALSIALERNPLDRSGGFEGTLTNVPSNKNVHLSRVGLSQVGELMSLDPGAPALRVVPTDVDIGGVIKRRDEPMQAGTYFGLAEQLIKGQVAALGQDGTCDADEASISAGACGTRSAWALSGDTYWGTFRVREVIDGAPLDDATMLFTGTGSFETFSSSVARDVAFSLQPLPRTTTGEPDWADQSHFTRLDLPYAQLPLGFEFIAALPPAPSYRAVPLEEVAGIGAALVPGRGVVPLGLGQAVERGVEFRMAPTHHGLEGSPYLVLIERRSSAQKRFAWAGRAVSVLLGRPTGLWFDSTGQRKLEPVSSTFLPIPEKARFHVAATATIPARSFRMPALADAASAVRVRFTDGLQTRWEVLVDPRAPDFTLPQVPGALRDRLFANGNAVMGVRAQLGIEVLRLARDGAPVETFTEFISRDDTAAERTLDRLAAFSFLDARPVRLAFKSPAVERGSTLVLTVEGFIIGSTPTSDGVVRVSFTGATGCPSSPVVLGTETSSGELQLALPSSCTGTAITIRAELVEPDRVTPLVPPVATSVTVSIP